MFPVGLTILGDFGMLLVVELLEKMVELNRIGPILKWYLAPPRPDHVITYCGLCIGNGITAHLLYLYVFAHLFNAFLAGALAGLCSVGLIALTLKRLGFYAKVALLISLGGMIVAAVHWVTIDLGFSFSAGTILTAFGLAISLPVFCRGMETIFP